MKKKAYKDIAKAKEQILQKFPNTSADEIHLVEVAYLYLPKYVRDLASQNGSVVPPLSDVQSLLRKNYSINPYIMQDLIANYYRENNLMVGSPIKKGSRLSRIVKISRRDE